MSKFTDKLRKRADELSATVDIKSGAGKALTRVFGEAAEVSKTKSLWVVLLFVVFSGIAAYFKVKKGE